jgi:hypothetical protein
MCVSCGCGKPNDNHGDDRHITQDDLNRAAQAAGISPSQAAQNIMNACQPTSQSSSGTSGDLANYGGSSPLTGGKES